MKHKLFITILVFFACSLASVIYGAEDEGSGRYALYLIEIDKKPTPILLDTKTGKIWIYTEEQGSGSSFDSKRAKFKGVTVDGLVYSAKDSKEFEQQIEQLHSDGFVNKDLRGFKETMNGEFFYSLDLQKIQAICERLKLTQPQKE